MNRRNVYTHEPIEQLEPFNMPSNQLAVEDDSDLQIRLQLGSTQGQISA